jgi:acetyl esterase/lipase
MRYLAMLAILVLAGCASQTADFSKTTHHYDIEYAQALLLDIYQPESAKPLPMIIFIHGGGWSEGGKEMCRDEINASLVTGRGYAFACIDYRLSGEAKFPAQMQDAKSALAWLKAHAKEYNIDPDRIGVWGNSAGGHLAALLGTESEVQAVADWFGPVDFIQVENVSQGEPYYAYTYAATNLLGGPIRDNHALAMEANPITHISANDPPFLIIHGYGDNTVPIAQSRSLYEALRAKGVEAEFLPVEGKGHGFPIPGPEFDKTMGFFDENLKSH